MIFPCVFFFPFFWVLGSDRFSLIQGTVQVSKFHFSIFGQTWVVSTGGTMAHPNSWMVFFMENPMKMDDDCG